MLSWETERRKGLEQGWEPGLEDNPLLTSSEPQARGVVLTNGFWASPPYQDSRVSSERVHTRGAAPLLECVLPSCGSWGDCGCVERGAVEGFCAVGPRAFYGDSSGFAEQWVGLLWVRRPQPCAPDVVVAQIHHACLSLHYSVLPIWKHSKWKLSKDKMKMRLKHLNNLYVIYFS